MKVVKFRHCVHSTMMANYPIHFHIFLPSQLNAITCILPSPVCNSFEYVSEKLPQNVLMDGISKMWSVDWLCRRRRRKKIIKDALKNIFLTFQGVHTVNRFRPGTTLRGDTLKSTNNPPILHGAKNLPRDIFGGIQGCFAGPRVYFSRPEAVRVSVSIRRGVAFLMQVRSSNLHR